MNEITAKDAWLSLQSHNSVLIDVRTEVEWRDIGYPDLSLFGKETKLISWALPSMVINKQFSANLTEQVKSKDTDLFFICKLSSRSANAAKFAHEKGYRNCFIIKDGVEGANGWKASNLPIKNLVGQWKN